MSELFVEPNVELSALTLKLVKLIRKQMVLKIRIADLEDRIRKLMPPSDPLWHELERARGVIETLLLRLEGAPVVMNQGVTAEIDPLISLSPDFLYDGIQAKLEKALDVMAARPKDGPTES